MKRIFLLFFLLFNVIIVAQQDLPRHLTQEEIELMRTYIPPISGIEETNPPPFNVRTIAEWEQLDGIIITWTSYTTILRQIVAAAQKEGWVYIVCTDSNSVKSTLSSNGVPLVNLKFIITSFNSVWVRDYGPWSVYKNYSDSLFIVDWIYNRPRPQDDLVPVAFSNYTGIPIYQTTVSPNDLTHTGGNFMVDGLGTGFSSKLILNENTGKTEAQIDTIMKKYMGLTRYIKMNTLPYDGIHHIDMHMKLLDEETLLVGEYPPNVSDGPYIEANLQYVLSNFQTAFGKPYKVVRIVMPPDQFNRYPNAGGYYRTFTNSVFVNKTVIVPIYELQYDTTALRIYRESLPGYAIVGIDCNQIIPASGAIHCITKEVGVKEPVFISTSKLSGIQPSNNGYEITAIIDSKSGINNAKVWWSIDTSNGFQSVNMTNVVNNLFSAFIPEQSTGTEIFYYIEANSNSGKSNRKPIVGASGAYKFISGEVVPVELNYFSAYVVSNKVHFFWQSITEKNNNFYSVQKLIDNEWVEVKRVKGFGTSTSPQLYSVIEENVTPGNYQYRLVQNDFDGTYSVLKIIEVNVPGLDFSLEQNYPNPFNPETFIRFSLPKASSVSIKIYNMIGEFVTEVLNKDLDAGIHVVRFIASNFPSGNYIYEIKAGEYSARKKLSIVK